MAFWSSARLEQALSDTRINLIQPVTGGRVKQGAYELAVGDDYYVTSGVKKKLERNEVIKIPPGQLALLITSERVNMPLDTIGFISMKFKYKMRGLINVSGFHVDPGFRGRLKFAVYNAGNKPAHFSPGKPLFLIWFSELTGEPNCDYEGEHQDQDRISAEDIDQIYGKMASPAQLRHELRSLKSEVNILLAVGIALLVSIVGIIVSFLLDLRKPPEKAPPVSAASHISRPIEARLSVAARVEQAALPLLGDAAHLECPRAREPDYLTVTTNARRQKRHEG